MKRISIGFGAGKRLSLTAAVSLLFLLLTFAPAQANTDYVFFSVNGDTSQSTMTQGDMVGWGSNCAVGALLAWEIWIDIDADGLIDDPGDKLLFMFEIRDGDISNDGPPPDNNPVPDGWFITNPMLLGMAPAHYIFKVSEYESHTMAQRALVSNALPSPPNIFRGQVTVDGHPAPDPEILSYLWIEAGSDAGESQMWAALTDEYGNFEINIGEIGSGIAFKIDPPDISGYVTPTSIRLTASGIIEDVNFFYGAPTDSIYGEIRDGDGVLIPGVLNGYCGRRDGSGNKDFTALDGIYVIYFGPSEFGLWSVGLNWENLTPTYLVPNSKEIDNSSIHSQRVDFTCLLTDDIIYARVTENNGAPLHQYRVIAQSYNLQCGTQAVSDTGAENVVSLYISSLDSTGWTLGVSNWDNIYPIPPGYVLENGDLDNHSPGDTVALNFVAGMMVHDTVKVDPGDPPVNWNGVWVNVGRDGFYFGANPDNNGVFTIYADTGTYHLSANYSGYLSSPNGREIHLTADTTGGLGFTLNQTHCRVSGVLTNVPLPLDHIMGVPAYTANDNSGYGTMLTVDSITGQFGGYLCDGEWTLDPPSIFNRFSPGQGHLSIAEFPDTVKYIEFAYIDPSSVDEEYPVPSEYTLLQNYPNPFNGRTVIQYGLPEASAVTIEIYDLLGRLVESLQEGTQNAGYHKATWNAGNQPSGIYFYRIKAGEFTQMRKMLLLK